MDDALLTTQDRQERLSLAYAHAVAARAGYATSIYDLDRDGIDLRIQAGGAMRPAIEFQLKATINLGHPRGEHFHFQLDVRNYDLLRIPAQTPRLLVVLDLPRDEGQWMTITSEELVMRRRAYWLNLSGVDETENQETVTVRIPVQNVFDVDNLQALMDQSRGGHIQ